MSFRGVCPLVLVFFFSPKMEPADSTQGWTESSVYLFIFNSMAVPNNNSTCYSTMCEGFSIFMQFHFSYVFCPWGGGVGWMALYVFYKEITTDYQYTTLLYSNMILSKIPDFYWSCFLLT